MSKDNSSDTVNDTDKNIRDKKYTELYKELHENDERYGESSVGFLGEAKILVDFVKPKTVLDFGCGKGALLARLAEHFPQINFFGYDPSIKGREKIPVEKADMIINTDVLEHIPENIIENVVEQIAGLSQKVFFVLHHAEAGEFLSNGENAHCTIKPPEWYHKMFSKYFDVVTPLPCREKIRSAVVTFTLPDDVKAAYLKSVNSNFIPRWLGFIICAFIFNRKRRKYFRLKYVKLKNND